MRLEITSDGATSSQMAVHVQFVLLKVITEALLGGPPPMEFSFGLFGALPAPAFGLAFWLAVGGGTWPMVRESLIEMQQSKS